MQETKESKRQANISKVKNKLQEYLKKYENRFDAIAYTRGALKHLETNDSLETLDIKEFIKEKNDDKDKNSKDDKAYQDKDNKLGFTLIQDGSNLVAVGADGSILDGKNFEEINDQVCKEFASKAKAEGCEKIVSYRSDNPEELKIFAKTAILKYGLTIGGGYPKDTEFWKELKNEYLKEGKHSQEDWEKITRQVPNDIMQRTNEEIIRNKNLLAIDNQLEKVRNKLTPEHPSTVPVPSKNTPQKLKSNSYTNQGPAMANQKGGR